MIKPKKSLGQHFLRSRSTLISMCDAAAIVSGDTVLEIGPGEGVLTEVLLEKGASVVALEKDHRLISFLEEKFQSAIAEKKLIIKEVDVLEFDPAELPPYKIVANIPYYITGAILEKFLSATHQPSSMTLLVQKEVARRIVARDGKESILSISVKAYGLPRYVDSVSKKLFSPVPKVDSAILHIENISRDFFKEINEGAFFKLVKAGFSHKRKMLKGNLKDFFTDPAEALRSASLSETARAEDISLKDWGKLLGAKS